MITHQQLYRDGDTVRLHNVFDISMAKSLAHDRTQSGGERNSTFYCMGHIPPEMWQYDPWLMQARKARWAGDKAEYNKMVEKFFDVHPAFKVINPKKYYSGGLTK